MNKKDRICRKGLFRRKVGKRHYDRRENAVLHHGDELKHFLLKAEVGFRLRSAGHDFCTEVEFPNGKICDVFDLDTFIVYELESDLDRAARGKKLEDFGGFGFVQDVIVLDVDGLEVRGDGLEKELVL